MSHRSRLCAAYVDVPRHHYDESVRFYSELTGHTAEIDDDYASFGKSAAGVEMLVQAVGEAASRAHLDIETDDIDAEVARLVGLGATETARIEGWVVLADPVGNPFCVIKIQDREIFEAHATTWA
jgi:predicted enzyme related to lactoylglutathione lyase